MAVVLENGRIAVAVTPEFGGRVTTLIDRVTGREWMAQGSQSANVGEDAIYARDEAVGWDECFPTVAPWDASGTMWGRVLRDHGDLWGRPWAVNHQSETMLDAALTTSEFSFRRRLEIEDSTLRASYSVTNQTSIDLPYLWALHGLLAVTPEDRIVLPGVDEVTATYLSIEGRTLQEPDVAWPSNDALPFALDAVQPQSRNFAGKFYAHGIAERRTAIGHGDRWLTISWDAAIDDLGLWFNYGAWPGPPGTYHVAFEPTTGPVDHLGQALQAGSARWLKPGATNAWTITLSLAEDAA